MIFNRYAIATCVAPAVLVLALAAASALLPAGFGAVTVFGAGATALVVLWTWSRIRALYGVALVLAGAEGARKTLEGRGVIVSRYKALEIASGLYEAQRVARERKNNP